MTQWNPAQGASSREVRSEEFEIIDKFQPPAEHGLALTIGLFLLIASPIVLFYLLLQLHLVNIPYWDDYDSILAFMIHFVGLKGFSEKIFLLLFTQHNEYKIIFGNILFVLEYLVTGSINFIYLQIIGNLFVLLLLFSIYKIFSYQMQKKYNRLIYFVPVPFFIFQLQYWNTLDWASSALQNITVIPFVILSLYYLSKKNTRDFYISCVFLILAVFSSGNGLFVIPLGLLMLFQTKQFHRMAPWTILSIILISMYFYNYSFGTGRELSLDGYLKHFDVIYALSFLGSAASNNNYHIASILGGGFLVVFLAMIFMGVYKTNPALFYTVLFVIISALVVSMIRSKLGISESLSSRYRIYSDVLLVTTYIFMVTTYLDSRKMILFFACLLAIPFCIYSDLVNYPHLMQRYNQLENGVSSWRMTGYGLTYPFEKRANALMYKAMKLKIYSPPILEKQ